MNDLFTSLPEGLRSAPAFLDRLTGRWRYEFGHPIAGLPRESVALGTHMLPTVSDLCAALVGADTHLTSSQLSLYLGRLGDLARHQDVLVEMLPVQRLSAEATAEFEVVGPGGTTVDWRFRRPAGPDVLCEVKNRIADVVRYLIQTVDQRDLSVAPPPSHDPRVLMRNLESKFSERDPVDQVQGGWIVTKLKQEADELRRAFASLDELRVHFVLLNNGHREAYLLAREHLDENDLLQLFGLERSERLVYRQNS